MVASEDQGGLSSPLGRESIELSTLSNGAPPKQAGGKMAHTTANSFSSHRDTQDENDDEQNDVEQDDLLGEAGAGYTPYLGRLALIACLSGLQFGMDVRLRSVTLKVSTTDASFSLSVDRRGSRLASRDQVRLRPRPLRR